MAALMLLSALVPQAVRASGAASGDGQWQARRGTVIQASATSPAAKGSTLAWRAAGTPAPIVKAAAAEVAEPKLEPEHQPADVEAPTQLDKPTPPAKEPKAVPEAAELPKTLKPARGRVRRLSIVPSRSKTRDAVLQVSTDDFDKPGDSLSVPGVEETTTSELSQDSQPTVPERSDLPSDIASPNDSKLFPEDEMPAEPQVNQPEPSLREPEPSLTEPEPSQFEPEPSMPDQEAPIPDVESGVTPQGEISCKDEEKNCESAIENLRGRDIRKIAIGVSVVGEGGKPAVEGRDYPCECALGLRTRFRGRDWAPLTMTWKASAQCHKPLYFEDVQLERYGHSWNPVVQPFLSAAHFFVSVPLLPYKMGLHPPNECMYTLGYYRPGDCAPYMIEPIPISLRAGVYQALGVTGFAFWFWPPVTPFSSATVLVP